VLLVEDIIDTGNTLARLSAEIEHCGAASVGVATLLDKKVGACVCEGGGGAQVQAVRSFGRRGVSTPVTAQAPPPVQRSPQTRNPPPHPTPPPHPPQGRRQVDFAADYAGFDCPNEFIVGYGLDYNETYRCLPYVAVLRPEAYGGHH